MGGLLNDDVERLRSASLKTRGVWIDRSGREWRVGWWCRFGEPTRGGGRRETPGKHSASQGGRTRAAAGGAEPRNQERTDKPPPRARGAQSHPTADAPMPPRSRSTAAARTTSRPTPQATPPSPPAAYVRLACAACMRSAACAAARRAASACCARACLCRFACAQARGRRTRHRDLPPTLPRTPPRVRTHVHEEACFERPSSPPRSRRASPEQARRTSPAASHLEGGRDGAEERRQLQPPSAF